MSTHEEIVRSILDNLGKYATAFTEAYQSFLAAGLSPDVAAAEARTIAWLSVVPAPKMGQMPNIFGGKVDA